MERESVLQKKISQAIEERLQKEFDARVKQLLNKIEEKEAAIKNLEAQAELERRNKEATSMSNAKLVE